MDEVNEQAAPLESHSGIAEGVKLGGHVEGDGAELITGRQVSGRRVRRERV